MDTKALLFFYSKYKMIIFPAVVVLSCLILVIFVIFPQLMSLLSGRTTEGELSNKIKFLEVKAQTLQSINEQDLDIKVNTVLGALPADKDYANVMSALQSAVTKWGFTIDSFTLSGQDVKAGSSQGYLTNVEITGARALLPSLLNDIESMNRVMRIESLQVSGGQDAAGVKVSLAIIALYAPAPSTFGGADSPLPTLSEKDEEIITKLTSTAPAQVVEIGVEEVVIPTGKVNPFE